MTDLQQINALYADKLAGLLGISFDDVGDDEIKASMEISPLHLTPSGFVQTSVLLALADSACSIGCMANLPAGASGFLTIECKPNLLGTVRGGIINCIASITDREHASQTWEATISCQSSGRTIAQFHCAQHIIYPGSPRPKPATTVTDKPETALPFC